MVQVTLKLSFDRRAALGPGKVKLLEAIAETGSISAAGRTMGMSYRRAWTLVADLNRSFVEPLVATQLGGSGGGGAALTRLGKDVVKRYRSIEARIRTASRTQLQRLETVVVPEAIVAGREAGGPSRR